MNIYITLDYELFFGAKSGSVEKAIIIPTQELLKITDSYNIKLVFFVDVGYLVKLEEEKVDHPELEMDYELITEQVKYLAYEGHGIELHVHPHWENSYYNGEKWVFNTSRYKLSDFSEAEIKRIVSKYADTLTSIAGKAPKAFRAGGWSAQPFKHIGKALLENNIKVDSTVFPNGYYVSPYQYYDFRAVKQYRTKYRFSEDLTIEDEKGEFTEIPISSYRVSPVFFWKFALTKLLKKQNHKPFGDGSAITKTKKDTLRLLLTYSNTVVSIDGYKARLLMSAYEKYHKNTSGLGNFVIIGHPKAMSKYSLRKLDDFLRKLQKNNTFKTF